MTIDRNDPLLKEIHEDGPFKGQQKAYLTLSDEERAKGFVRPVRLRYQHLACGTFTTMGQNIAETYARDPKFYSGTFCINCGKHFPLLKLSTDHNGNPKLGGAQLQFLWEDGEAVGS